MRFFGSKWAKLANHYCFVSFSHLNIISVGIIVLSMLMSIRVFNFHKSHIHIICNANPSSLIVVLSPLLAAINQKYSHYFQGSTIHWRLGRFAVSHFQNVHFMKYCNLLALSKWRNFFLTSLKTCEIVLQR